jgi:Skp family chaperone for outer membrane proteins
MRIFLVFCTIIVISPGWAQELKFGFVEDQQIMDKLPAVKEVQRVLDQETAIWEKEFTDHQSLLKVYLDSVTAAETSLTQARETLQAAEEISAGRDTSSTPMDSTSSGAGEDKPGASVEQAGTAVDTIILRRELEMLEQKLEHQKKETIALYRKIYGENGVLERRNAELSQSILERVEKAIIETCEQEEHDFVFESSILLYVNQEVNFTSKVMETLGIGEQRLR